MEVDEVEVEDQEQQGLNPDDPKLKLVQASKLYDVKITNVSMPIVYHRIYNIGFFGMEKLHPFDAGKWGKIYSFLEAAQLISEDRIVEPREAHENDLLVVHTKAYLNKLKWSAVVAAIMEVPPVALLPNIVVQRKALKPFRYQTGGTILAAKLCLEKGWAINLGGGFHHCSSNRGGGFCAYADITLALEFLFVAGLISKAMIVDLDAHQGNGYERDFLGDDRVYIMDMFNAYIYPFDHKAKRAIRRKVELMSGTGDAEYLKLLTNHLKHSLSEFKPDILVYNAGTDCLEGDPLGCLRVTAEGIIKRDELVFAAAKERGIPIVMVTSGGYQRSNARIISDSILNLYSKDLITRTFSSASVEPGIEASE